MVGAEPPRDRDAMIDIETAPAVEIRSANGAELAAGAALLADSLGFGDRDAIPAWIMQTTLDCGGIALGAFRGEVLGGFSYAIPCGEQALFSCGLAVLPEWRGQGVGRRLKLAQRDQALRQGCTHIRWTADPLSAAALTLYLSGLGARLTEYRAELYAATRPAPVPPDDVVIDWMLRGDTRYGGRSAQRIEVPFDHTALGEQERLRWRLRVRSAMRRALDEGAIGTGMAVDRAARRCWVLFERP
jgi:predicted GNAT superfamily acetyltransferase